MLVVRTTRVFDSIAGVNRKLDALHVLDGKISTEPGAKAVVEHELDLRDYYVYPGLIDSHLHLCFDAQAENPVEQLKGQSDVELLPLMREQARCAARRGVTTVRDLGDRSYLALVLREEGLRDRSLPYVIASGPPLTSVGGHCHFLGGEIGDRRAGLRAVRDHASRGADVLKVMVTGGVLTASSDIGSLQFTETMIVALRSLATRLGLELAYHCHSAHGIAIAARVGGGTIEHCTYADVEDERELESNIAELARAGVVVSPTLVERPGVDWDSDFLSWRKVGVREMIRRRIRVIAGTDAGVKTALSHDSLPWAVATLIDAGLPPSRAIQAATCHSAAALGLASSKGALLPGRDADLIAYAEDPLATPEALASPSLVMIRGGVTLDAR